MKEFKFFSADEDDCDTGGDDDDDEGGDVNVKLEDGEQFNVILSKPH